MKTLVTLLVVTAFILSGCILNPPKEEEPPLVRVTTESDYTHMDYNDFKSPFPRLPNPDIYMYVPAHLSPEGAIVPGYTSYFPMYTEVHYALPGDLYR